MAKAQLPEGYASWTQAARYLSKQFGESVTRQQVNVWHRRRGHNGFPHLHEVRDTRGRCRQVLRLSEAEEWMAAYRARQQRVLEILRGDDTPAGVRYGQGPTADHVGENEVYRKSHIA
jgi:hypothetical protein